MEEKELKEQSHVGGEDSCRGSDIVWRSRDCVIGSRHLKMCILFMYFIREPSAAYAIPE